MNKYVENGYLIAEYPNGTVIRSLISNELPIPEPVKPQETLEQKIVRLEGQLQADNLVTFEVLATIFEELLEIKSKLKAGE